MPAVIHIIDQKTVSNNIQVDQLLHNTIKNELLSHSYQNVTKHYGLETDNFPLLQDDDDFPNRMVPD